MRDLKIEEVAIRVGVSVQTLNRWYKFKKEHPEDEVSKLIPDFTKKNTSCGFVRVWNDADVWKLVDFKTTQVKSGRTGRMGKYGGKGTKNDKEDVRAVNS